MNFRSFHALFDTNLSIFLRWSAAILSAYGLALAACRRLLSARTGIRQSSTTAMSHTISSEPATTGASQRAGARLRPDRKRQAREQPLKWFATLRIKTVVIAVA